MLRSLMILMLTLFISACGVKGDPRAVTGQAAYAPQNSFQLKS